MTFLVTGGAGYIGSHMVRYLQSLNKQVDVIDNLSTGNRLLLKDCDFYNIDLREGNKLLKLLERKKYECIFHFAASSISKDSYKFQNDYLENNLSSTKNLTSALLNSYNDKLIFSSSASVYGVPQTKTIDEAHQTEPISPYGKSKLECEKYLEEISCNTNLKAISLRYFNAAGANYREKIGEMHDPETHLIPSILNSILNKSDHIKIYGDSYETTDGTCVRDYVHVDDLVRAHYSAYKYLSLYKKYSCFNLGSGRGYSILEVVKICEDITNTSLKYKFYPKREGDTDILISNINKAKADLNFKNKFDKLEDIVNTAWQWHKWLYNSKRP